MVLRCLDLTNNDVKSIYEFRLETVEQSLQLLEHPVNDGVLPLLNGFCEYDDVADECSNAGEVRDGQSWLDYYTLHRQLTQKRRREGGGVTHQGKPYKEQQYGGGVDEKHQPKYSIKQASGVGKPAEAGVT